MLHVSSKANLRPLEKFSVHASIGVAGSGGEASGGTSKSHRNGGTAIHSREAHDSIHRGLSPEAGSGTGS